MQISGWLPPYFFATLAAAAFGAFSGAWITSRIDAKRQAIAELNNISAALMLCFSICNRTIGLKRQFIIPMRDDYERVRREYSEAVANQSQIGTTIFTLRAELKTLPIQKMPTDLLERHVFEKISIRGRALAAAIQLIGAIDELNQAIRFGNDFITNEFQKVSPVPPKLLAEKYLGVRTAAGVTDERFPTTVAGIVQLTDDCIFFSRLLADDLLKFGKSKRRRHTRRLMLGLPKISGADWSQAEKAGLLPSAEYYEPWINGFKIMLPWWKRLFVRLRSVQLSALRRAPPCA